MKVVTPKQMSEIENLAYNEGASAIDFMEEAGSGVALVVHDLVETEELDPHVVLLCGKGNNAGDAYVAGVQLLHLEYEVIAYQLFDISTCSELCRENYQRFLDSGGEVREIHDGEQISFLPNGVIVDGIFGSGFYGTTEEPVSSVIRQANASRIPIVAVDIPSGLDGATGEVNGEAIIAHTTAFLGLPKLGFFLKEGWNHVGRLSYVDFGLSPQYIQEIDSELIMLDPTLLTPLIPPIKRDRHKYEAGEVVGLAGSPSMPGAALLASLAALCSGAGIVRLLHPVGMEVALSGSPYELIKIPYELQETEMIVNRLNHARGTFIGPGLGVTPETRQLLRTLIPELATPCVLDADALTIFSEEQIAYPAQAILTPHLGELKRLMNLEIVSRDFDFLRSCSEYASLNNVTLILKGGPSFIFHPNAPMMVCPRGDPGMATAGSGDVLTGMLASLLAQGLSPHHAAMLGVYLHGLAGEFASATLTPYCMTASDLIAHFPEAFNPHNLHLLQA